MDVPFVVERASGCIPCFFNEMPCTADDLAAGKETCCLPLRLFTLDSPQPDLPRLLADASRLKPVVREHLRGHSNAGDQPFDTRTTWGLLPSMGCEDSVLRSNCAFAQAEIRSSNRNMATHVDFKFEPAGTPNA